MHFVRLIRDNIYSPSFYKTLKDKPLSFSFKYYATLALGISLVLTAYLSFILIPRLHAFLRSVGPTLIQNFPDELVLTIEKGKVSVNVGEPYRVSLPSSFENLIQGGGAPSLPGNLLVIDTKAALPLQDPIERFEAYDTLVLITENVIAYREPDKAGIRIEPTRNFPDAVIDKRKVVEFADSLGSFTRFLSPLAVFGIFFVMLLVFSVRLSYLLLAALLIWGVLRIKGISTSYKKSYQIGIHAMTLGVLVSSLGIMMSSFGRVPLLFTILLLLTVFINVKKEEGGVPLVESKLPPSSA